MTPIRLLLAALLFGLLIACDTTNPGLPNPPVEEPEFLIRNAKLDPWVIAPGQSATLSWEAGSDEVEVVIAPLGLPFRGSGSVSVSPAVTTEYNLTASFRGGAPEGATLTLVVDEPGEPPIVGGPSTIEGFVYTPSGAALEPRYHDMLDVSGVLPDDPLLRDNNTLTVGFANAWLLPPTGDKVTVAFVGAGIRTQHEDFGPALLRGYDFCADFECSETDDDVDTADYTSTYPYDLAESTVDVGLLVASAGNGVGGAGLVGPHRDFEVLPLKVVHTEPRYAGDTPVYPESNSSPAAYLKALAYALGGDPGEPGLAPREPVDILYLATIPYNRDTRYALTPEQEAELRSLLQRARDLDVLIVAPGRVLAEEIEYELDKWESNPLGVIAGEYRDIVLSVETLRDPAGDVRSAFSMVGPMDVAHQTIINARGEVVFSDHVWGGYLADSTASPVVAQAALMQRRDPALRGAALRDALLESVCDAACGGLGEPHLGRALGLPGVGDTLVLELKNSAGEVVESLETPVGFIEQVEYAMDFIGGDTFTLEGRVAGAKYTLSGSTTFTIGSGFQMAMLLLDTLTPNE